MQTQQQTVLERTDATARQSVSTPPAVPVVSSRGREILESLNALFDEAIADNRRT